MAEIKPKAPAKYRRSHERRLARQEVRRAIAEDRQLDRDRRSTAGQLALLDERPGDSARERARLTE